MVAVGRQGATVAAGGRGGRYPLKLYFSFTPHPSPLASLSLELSYGESVLGKVQYRVPHEICGLSLWLFVVEKIPSRISTR